MKKIIICIFIMSFIHAGSVCQEIFHSGPSVDFTNGPLKISENGRFLIHANGTPFYYFGGTAWELFHRCTREEAEIYLENRRNKGFTVIQAVALAELDGIKTPNVYGDLPLIDQDPLRPNEKYWKHVDWVIKKAEEKGLYIGLLPTWGDKVDKQWGTGPEIFTEKNAFAYGKWIANRYKEYVNIIWINGGDRDCAGKNTPIWDALGKGIKSVDNNHLMTFHPWGGTSSSQCFHDADWLDFNMLQSGHGEKYGSNYDLISADYSLSPIKPCIDGEPNYEDHAIKWSAKYGWFDDSDVRRACYWGIFSGGMGITYGAHPIWQMKHDQHNPVGDVRRNWDQALDLDGAWDMIHIRRLLESRPFNTAIPDNSVIVSDRGNFTNRLLAIRGEGFIMIYLPASRHIQFKAYKLKAEQLNAWWYNPRTGEAHSINTLEYTSEKVLPVPVLGVDWILVVDDASYEYPAPGTLNNN